jgi:hypothetical protein
MAFSSTTLDDGTVVLSNDTTFSVTATSPVVVEEDSYVLPSFAAGEGKGRLVHPTLGAYDYEAKPDEWVNMDGDAIVKPKWSSTMTLGGAANTLWKDKLRDVKVEERWKALGGLAMPMTQMRMLLMMLANPVDPAVGYVLWYPNYVNNLGFKVILLDVKTSGDDVVFDDVVNAKHGDGTPNGWMTNPVTVVMKIAGREYE